MSVYQVEEYYIHIDISEMNTRGRLKTTKYLDDNNCDDYELQTDGNLTVDNFESESDAENIEHGIEALLEDNLINNKVDK